MREKLHGAAKVGWMSRGKFWRHLQVMVGEGGDRIS